MTNPVETKISTFAKAEEAKIVKWYQTNYFAFLMGAAVVGLLWFIAHKL